MTGFSNNTVARDRTQTPSSTEVSPKTKTAYRAQSPTSLVCAGQRQPDESNSKQPDTGQFLTFAQRLSSLVSDSGLHELHRRFENTQLISTFQPRSGSPSTIGDESPSPGIISGHQLDSNLEGLAGRAASSSGSRAGVKRKLGVEEEEVEPQSQQQQQQQQEEQHASVVPATRGDLSSTSPTSSTITRPSRRTKVHVPAACSNCKRAHLSCDVNRPCNRCVQTGKQSTCVDVVHKKRGRPRLRESQSNPANSTYTAPGSQEILDRQPLGNRIEVLESRKPVAGQGFGISGTPVPPWLIAQPPTFPLAERPIAFLDSNLKIQRTNVQFNQILPFQQRPFLGLGLEDIVDERDIGGVKALANKLREERMDSQHLPPILMPGSSDLDLIPAIEHADLAAMTRGHHEHFQDLRFPGFGQDLFHATSLKLARVDSFYFVVLILLGIRPTEVVQQRQSPRLDRESAPIHSRTHSLSGPSALVQSEISSDQPPSTKRSSLSSSSNNAIRHDSTSTASTEISSSLYSPQDLFRMPSITSPIMGPPRSGQSSLSTQRSSISTHRSSTQSIQSPISAGRLMPPPFPHSTPSISQGSALLARIPSDTTALMTSRIHNQSPSILPASFHPDQLSVKQQKMPAVSPSLPPLQLEGLAAEPTQSLAPVRRASEPEVQRGSYEITTPMASSTEQQASGQDTLQTTPRKRQKLGLDELVD